MESPQTPTKTTVFLSYRREDTIETVGRMYSWLTSRLSEEEVFFDVRSIPPGANYRERMNQALVEADFVLVIMGKAWNAIRQLDGTIRRRLEEPDDAVRHEIELAIENDKMIIPVLTQGVSMPRADELPDSIRLLALVNAIPVRPDPDFDKDMRVLRDAMIHLREVKVIAAISDQLSDHMRWHQPIPAYTPTAYELRRRELQKRAGQGSIISRLALWWLSRNTDTN